MTFEKKLIIEVDGPQHELPQSRAYDAARTRYLESRGFRVTRFAASELLDDLDGVMVCIYNDLQMANPSPGAPRRA